MLRVQSHGHRQVGLTARQRMARSLRKALAFSARIADENVSCPTAIVMLDHGFGMIVPGELASQPRKVCLWRMAALLGLRRLFRSWMKSRLIADVVVRLVLTDTVL